MTTTKLGVFLAGVALAVLTVGCSETTTNTNARNGNTAVLTNGNGNTPIVATTNSNAARDDDDVTREEFDKERSRYEREAKESGRKVGTGADDLWIWTKTRAALAAADDLRDSTVDVDVENNVVTLSGTVASQAQKTRAEQVAQKIDGVKNVTNRLTVSATGDTNGNANRGAAANRNTNARN
jgi:hyperosmotically inducible protein